MATLEPDVVKLDLALVRGAHADPVRRRLIGSVASACRELGILVVAEGVESTEDRVVVIEAGCDLLQGFLLGKPQREPVTPVRSCRGLTWGWPPPLGSLPPPPRSLWAR